MGEAAVKARVLKARMLGKVDDWNADHDMPGIRITRAQRDVFKVIIDFVARGRCFPSYDLIATLAPCCPDTVRVAIRNLRRAGLLAWSNVWRWNEQARKVTKSSNHYRIGDGVPALTPHKTELQRAPQQESKKWASRVYGAPVDMPVSSADDWKASPYLLAVLNRGG